MIVLNYSHEVLDELFAIHDGSFPFPDCDDPTFIEKKVAVHNGRVVGVGFVKLTTEFSLILNKRESKRIRVLAVEKLQDKLIDSLNRKGIRDTHIFVNDPIVSKFARHIGFQDCPEKEVLSLRFGY